MSPVRIIILALLFYFLYRLLFTPKKPGSRRETRGRHLEEENNNILVEDPVCHTYVVQGQSLSAVKDGKKYYFCSEECRQKFLSQK